MATAKKAGASAVSKARPKKTIAPPEERVLDVVQAKPTKSTQKAEKPPAKVVAKTPAQLAGISFHDQDVLANDPDFQGRVGAAAFSAAIFMFKQADNPDATKQARRAALIKTTINNPDNVVEPMARLVVSQQTTPATFIVDDSINTVLTTPSLFDGLAGQLFPNITP